MAPNRTRPLREDEKTRAESLWHKWSGLAHHLANNYRAAYGLTDKEEVEGIALYGLSRGVMGLVKNRPEGQDNPRSYLYTAILNSLNQYLKTKSLSPIPISTIGEWDRLILSLRAVEYDETTSLRAEDVRDFCLRFVTPSELSFLLERVAGYSPKKLAHVYGRHRQKMVSRYATLLHKLFLAFRSRLARDDI